MKIPIIDFFLTFAIIVLVGVGCFNAVNACSAGDYDFCLALFFMTSMLSFIMALSIKYKKLKKYTLSGLGLIYFVLFGLLFLENVVL